MSESEFWATYVLKITVENPNINVEILTSAAIGQSPKLLIAMIAYRALANIWPITEVSMQHFMPNLYELMPAQTPPMTIEMSPGVSAILAKSTLFMPLK
ncbi:hypothetical protein FACS1894113_3820 [Alphaproteobacteria bacterium]|nr:hypothetical protein FACS1894113_3820 [Alphaproteobacteria bacterium]